MKRKIVLFTAVAGIFSLTLSSFHDGMKSFNAAHSGAITNNPITGITIGSNTVATASNCGGDFIGHSSYPNCHTADNNLSVSLAVYTSPTYGATTLSTLKNFVPGHKYGIRITGDYSVTASNDTAFGFQCTLFGWHAGSTTPLEPGVVWTGESDVTIDTTHLYGAITVDHKQTLHNHGTTGNKFHFQASFPWTAPDASSTIDSVQIRTLMCAVDGDGTYQNDAHNGAAAGFTTLHLSTVGLKELFNNASFSTFPNPATNNVSIKMDNLGEGGYVMYAFDINGNRILNRNIEVNGTTHTENIDISAWPVGAYFVQVARYGVFKTIPVVKK